MRARVPLWSKILFLAFLNLCLLGLALALIVRAQFRFDPASFLLAPAQSRIMSMAQALALELDEAQPGSREAIIQRYAQTYGVSISVFDESGQRIAGPEQQLPREVVDRIPRRQTPPQRQPRPGDNPAGRPGDRPAPRPGRPRPPRPGDNFAGAPEGRPAPDQAEPERAAPNRGAPASAGSAGKQQGRTSVPPLFLTTSAAPTRYWAGVRVPLRTDPQDNPHPATMLLETSSLLGNRLFFDVTPWVAIAIAVIAISFACWLPFIRGMTKSISQMTRAAGQIAEGRFEIHVAGNRRDEIGQLGEAINRMACRLDGFVGGQKRFLSGIAHELCTPIATMQFGLGNLERRVEEEQRDSVADIQEEVQHMSALVNELLSFSRSGMRALEAKLVPVNVAAMAARVLERESSPSVNITVSLRDDLHVLADEEYLFRALSNVVRNAVRYAGHAGPIHISARSEEGMVFITVDDNGPGVPERSLEEIFAPFYRVDPSRSRETGGLGLGLAIVRDCIESCRGAVRCRNRQPSGLEVEIRLPAAQL